MINPRDWIRVEGKSLVETVEKHGCTATVVLSCQHSRTKKHRIANHLSGRCQPISRGDIRVCHVDVTQCYLVGFRQCRSIIRGKLKEVIDECGILTLVQSINVFLSVHSRCPL